MPKITHGHQPNYIHQPIVIVDNIATQNTWYTVVDLTGNLMIHFALIVMATADETIEKEFTIDGTVMTSSANAIAGTVYYIYRNTTSDITVASTGLNAVIVGIGLECRNFRFRIRKTTAAGANHLFGYTVYSRR